MKANNKNKQPTEIINIDDVYIDVKEKISKEDFITIVECLNDLGYRLKNKKKEQ